MQLFAYRRLAIGTLIVIAALANSVRAERNDPPDSLKQGRNSLVALPYAYYTPETKIAFGAGAVYSFRRSGDSPADRPSNVRLALTYTQLKQAIIAFLPEIYFKDEDYFFSGFYGYYRYPDKFWGIGNDTPDEAGEDFEPVYFSSYTSLQKRAAPGLYVGLRHQYEYISLKEAGPEGVLQYGTIPGSEGGNASGLGIVVNYDTRNHIYQPSAGFYNQIFAVFFRKATGSDYEFELLSIDLRKYFSVFGSHVLALQTYDGFISGTPPFQMLNMLGGSYWMRGYRLGRYRDKNRITFQAEYRFPLFWRFGAVGFAGLGDVSSGIDGFRLNRFKYSLGFGFRFVFDTRERINARLDIGFAKGGDSGVYALVLEAF